MINTLLVLVSISVYTFVVSNTMFVRQGHRELFIQGTLVVGRDAGFIVGQTRARIV
jgi:hypothetical protein